LIRTPGRLAFWKQAIIDGCVRDVHRLRIG
jgi:hypothetical protein